MSGKRQATSDLNHDNWDREEEPEDRGTFRTAPQDELKNRVIKKAARRKVAGSASDDTDGGNVTKSVFSGFAGFSTTPASTAAVSPFSFLSKIPAVAVSEASSSDAGSNSKTTVKPSFSFGGAATAASPKKTISTESVAESKKPKPETSSPTKPGEKSSNYYAKLKGLNTAVSEWIKTHVDKNPLCLLTPIFKDYEKHLSDIGKEESDKSTSFGQAAFKFSTTPAAASSTQLSIAPPATTATASSFSFGSSPTFAGTAAATTTASTTSIFGGSSKPDNEAAPKSNGFSFGLKANDQAKAATSSGLSGFSFGSSASTGADEKKSSGFSFTPGSTPFSFGNIKPPPAAVASTSTAQAGEENEEDEPPKVEFKQVVEEDAVYSKKCKVFVKKDGNFVDRGVGTLHLKPVKDSEKTQLLVRADTNLGNILVNLILSAGLPAQRMGKNNVMLVCLPTPDAEKPTSMLMRVKTGEEADELLAAIEKYKK